jgi:hypothetical integral membrane protein (TIGR02206 family)
VLFFFLAHPMSFELFGAAHLLALFLTVATPVVISLIARRSGSSTLGRAICYCLAVVLIATEMTVLVASYFYGTLSWEYALPMHLCDWALIATVLTLLWRWQVTYELAFFWALGGSSMAILTPDVQFGFANIGTMLFFVAHCTVVASVLYLTLGMKMRLWPHSLLRVFLISQIYVILTLAVNFALDTNYGYLRAKPRQPSLLDYMGPWPYYIISLEVLGALMLLVVYSPFYIMDRVRARNRR